MDDTIHEFAIKFHYYKYNKLILENPLPMAIHTLTNLKFVSKSWL